MFAEKNESCPRQKRSAINRKLYPLLSFFVFVALFYQGSSLYRTDSITSAYAANIYQEGLAQCLATTQRPVSEVASSRANPRFEGGLSILLQNSSLINGDGTILYRMSVLMENGVFTRVFDSKTKEDLTISKDTLVYDIQGRFITPGLVDMHSHAAVDSYPEFWGTEDTNEISGPVTSQMRTIDAMNVDDVMIKRIMSGGITSSLILPGSANLIGGEAYVIKHSAKKSLEIEDYLLQSGEKGKRQRWLKMACGENPKRVYPTQTNTRMGSAWGFRHRFDQGRQLMHKQDAWCAKATDGPDHVSGTEFPSDLELESIVGVLRGDVQINNHCYETQDLEMQIRNSREFGFEIGAFHHALDAYRVPELLKHAPGNITIATFANLWGYKKEAFQASPYAGKILTDANIPLAYKSDHPVTNSQHLLYQSQLATHFELSDQLAIKAVTSVPATSLGLGHRIGYIRPGYDADLVIWDSYPLDLGAHPIQVFVDGAAQFEFVHEDMENPPKSRKVSDELTDLTKSVRGCDADLKDFVLTGLTAGTPREAGSSGLTSLDHVIVVSEGRVICRGSEDECATSKSRSLQTGAREIHVENGHLVPGIVTTAPNLGLGEIGAESSTQDGEVDSSKPKDADSVVTAYDGLVLNGPHIDRAAKSGVVEVIVAPGETLSAPGSDGDFLQGVSTSFRLDATSLLDPHAVTKKEVAVNFHVGDGSKGEKGTGTESISMQIRTLRAILTENAGKNNVYGRMSNGSLPMVIEVHSSDDMAHLILLKREFPDVYMVFKGCTEGYLLAKEIAEAGIPVLAYPRCMPSTWRTRRCLPGPPMSDDTNISVLLRHKVRLGLVGNDDGNLGEGYWEAAWAAKLVNEASEDFQISEKETLDLISFNVRDILRLPQPEETDFIVFSGSPLNVKSQIALTVSNGVVRHCEPRLD